MAVERAWQAFQDGLDGTICELVQTGVKPLLLAPTVLTLFPAEAAPIAGVVGTAAISIPRH